MKKDDVWYIKLLDIVTNRYNLLGVFFIAVGIIFTFKLADLQIINGAKYEKEAQEKIASSRTVTAERGNILDRNGLPIATNKRTFKAQIFNTGLKAVDLNDVLIRVYNILNSNGDGINNTLESYIEPKDNTFVFGKMMKSLTKQQDLVKRAKLHLAVDFKDNEKVTPEAVYNKLLAKYKIDAAYTPTQKFAIMCMRYESRLFSSVRAVAIANDISSKSVAEIEEKSYILKGVSTDKTSTRQYIDAKYISHILGYYRSDDDCTGLESKMQDYLKGKDGQNAIAVNADGQFVEMLDAVPAEPGDNVILSIDMRLQKTASKSLERVIKAGTADSGAAVAMNPNTGEIYAMASYPYYDPNVFLKSSEDKKAQKQIMKWFNSNKYPMLNRAIGASYPPGSTYKMVVSTTGLETKKITKTNSSIYDPGVVYFNGVRRFCLEGGHGWLSLPTALETSCNVYFYLLGVRCGIDNIEKWAKAYGLGEYTGIDLSGEVKGERSNKKSKARHYADTEGPWSELNTALSSIGQYLNRFTPIQMTRYGGALATNGTLVKPFVVKKVLSNSGTVKMQTQVEKKPVGASKATYDYIRQGMKQVVTGSRGTATLAFNNFKYRDTVTVAAKTGTAQMGVGQKDNSDFMCYAPANKPEIVIFVYLNKGGWGSNATPVAEDILTKYYDLKKQNESDPIEQLPDGLFK